jgi:ribonucleoside-diphosphate reductase alpha chain
MGLKIETITYDDDISVYDITVPETSSFFANGILVHNCSEIALPSSTDESFVCNLASMNLLTFDEWVNTDAVEVMIWFLDAVMEEYIEKTNCLRYMEASNKFARTWRALGLGQLGWHSYLQSKMIAFESLEAHMLGIKISKFIDDRSLLASKELAEEYGEPEGMLGYGLRNLTRCAIAPNVSSSFLLGQVSPSIEPLASNYFTKDLAKGKFTYKNPYLTTVLEAHGENTDDVWLSILQRGGSVQHLEFLTAHEKDVFKTFSEIAPISIVQQAAARQKYIDQAQSLNLLISPDAPIKDVNSLIIEGWRLGIKTLYYQRGTNPAQQLVRDIMTCSVCES